jgi:hypothetical protein
MWVKTHYKTEIVRRGKKLKDLAEALRMEYTKLSRILNGFSHEPPEFHALVTKVLDTWDKQKQNG